MFFITDWIKSLLRQLIREYRQAQPLATEAEKQQESSMSKVSVGSASQFVEGRFTKVDAGGTSVLVTRINGDLCAVRNQCAHLPVPLDGGKIEDGAVVCPFHNSKYDLCSGANMDWTPGVAGVRVPGWTSRLIALGQPPKNITAYPVTVEGDEVFIDI
ncbi:MAG: Rieske 2Fe-2S domain-containing protein [Chloroflexota bacterium]